MKPNTLMFYATAVLAALFILAIRAAPAREYRPAHRICKCVCPTSQRFAFNGTPYGWSIGYGEGFYNGVPHYHGGPHP